MNPAARKADVPDSRPSRNRIQTVNRANLGAGAAPGRDSSLSARSLVDEAAEFYSAPDIRDFSVVDPP